jgi:hypothetical protein
VTYPNARQRFEAKVDADDGCHLWTGRTDRWGVGKFRIKGREIQAPRYAWELAHGPIPEGVEIRHRCRNVGCVNVEHLYAVERRVRV